MAESGAQNLKMCE